MLIGKNIGAMITFGVIVLVWWGMTAGPNHDSLVSPTPTLVAKAALAYAGDWEFYQLLGWTVLKIVVAFVVCVLVGVSIGIVVGQVSLLNELLELPLDLFRSIPATALYPMFLVFGISEWVCVWLTMLVGVLVLVSYTIKAVSSCSAMRLQAGRAEHLKGSAIFFRVVFPECLPGIVNGARICLSLVIVLIVVFEMFGANGHGIGTALHESRGLSQREKMVALTIAVGFVGIVLNGAFTWVCDRLVFWGGR